MWTKPLVESLLDGNAVDQVWLFDNGSTDETVAWTEALAAQDQRFMVSKRPNARLYGMWNEMVSRASGIPGTSLAILNNDIEISPLALREMQRAMEGFDLAFVDREIGLSQASQALAVPASWLQRTGWAFMLRADFWRSEAFAIDPGLRIWWGDDDLARRAEARGARLCVIEGIGVAHEVSQSVYPGDIAGDIEHDREYFDRIWSE